MVEGPLRVLAIVPYHLDYCAGQRFRIELWAKELKGRGIEVEFLPFTNQRLTDVLYQQRQFWAKSLRSADAFIRQAVKTLRTNKPDLIFIYREAAVVGPPIIERIARSWDVPIVYDIDEPLFVPYVSPTNGRINRLKFFSKFDQLLKMSDSVFAVNRAIGDYAAELNDHVEIVPMAVDIERYRPAETKTRNAKPIITWVGTRTNQPNIEIAVPALQRLARERAFKFRIIADYEMSFDGLDVDFVPWSYAGEVEKLQESDIGITPVGHSPWSKWKFFFKTVQFMATGLPIVASAIGSNLEIVKNGENGFLADNEDEWYERLKILLDDEDLRGRIGERARAHAVEHFDLQKQFDFVENKFRSMAEKK